MALIDIYRKYMYGMPGQTSVDTGDVPATGMSSQGLFGVGGEPGKGGLLTNFQRPDDSGLLNVFSNPFVAIGLEGLQRGMKGQDISTALLPSVKSGLSLSENVKKIEQKKKQREFIKKYADQVPPEDKAMFEAFPEKYVTAVLTKKTTPGTLSKEAFKLYIDGQNAPDFNKWFDNLPQASKDLYNKQIKPNMNSLQAAFDFIQKQEDAILQTAPPIPLVNGSIDLDKIKESPGIVYNFNGQAVVYDNETKQLVPYKEYIQQ